MLRLIVIALIAYLAWRFGRRWLAAGRSSRRVDGNKVDRIDDVMVKDPECGSYFPRRDGVPLRRGDRELLFCSPDCRDKFLARNSNPTE